MNTGSIGGRGGVEGTAGKRLRTNLKTATDDNWSENMAENAEACSEGKHDGWEPTAWQGLQESIEVIASRGVKVVINVGALNPKGLAEKTHVLVRLS